MDLYVNPTITKFAQKVDGEITELKLGAKQEDAYAQIFEKGAESGGGKVENNKAATIDVSTYTTPVEITPTSGKNSMKKATITLSNIPSPSGSAIAYAWQLDETNYCYFDFSVAPSSLVGTKTLVAEYNDGALEVQTVQEEVSGYTKISDTSFSIETHVYTRAASKDFTLW